MDHTWYRRGWRASGSSIDAVIGWSLGRTPPVVLSIVLFASNHSISTLETSGLLKYLHGIRHDFNVKCKATCECQELPILPSSSSDATTIQYSKHHHDRSLSFCPLLAAKIMSNSDVPSASNSIEGESKQSVEPKPDPTPLDIEHGQSVLPITQPPSAPPDGGTVAWLQVVGAFFLWFGTL